MNRLACIGILASAISAASMHADVRLSGLFVDSVILQRNQPVPVWGWADPGEDVTVRFSGQIKAASADADGRWVVELDPMPATPEPQSLVVQGNNTVVVNDVLVGEVWLASGQSNMALRLAELDGAKEEIAAANDPLLRTLCVPERPGERPWADVTAQWLKWNEANGQRFSAMGYYFAKRLRKEIGVPVGILLCAWGGSSAASWTSRETLSDPALRPLLPEQVWGWRPNIQPSRLYNGMLHPLIPFGIAGVIWYQGETEGEPYQNAYLYRYFFPKMIQDWRRGWQRPDLPFFWVQLPNLRNKATWPVVRESQALALSLPDTGMIPTIDIGQENHLHPTNKADFADRLADLVLAKHYGLSTWAGPAVCEGVHWKGATAHLRIGGRGGELVTNDGQAPRGFEMAGENCIFHEAEARIADRTLVVSSASVPKPVAVRYGWQPTPRVNVVNRAGLPLVPFRTDDFPVPGQEMLPKELPNQHVLPSVVSGADLVLGRCKGWQPSEHAADCGLLARAGVVRGEPVGVCPLVVRDRPVRELPASPDLYWTLPIDVEVPAGWTVEVKVLPYRIGDPLRGFDLEACVRQRDGHFRRYLLTVFPMRLHALEGHQVRVLGSNLDNCTAAHGYRMAIRPDNVAQVYFDQQLMGTLAGEMMETNLLGHPYFRLGKTTVRGEWVVNLDSVALDLTGAYQP